MRRAALAAATVLVLATPTVAPVLGAQRADTIPQAPPQSHRIPRRLLFGVIGAVAGAGLGALYAGAARDSQPGSCSSSRCVATVTTLSGAVIGFMIGRELDQLHALRYRGGAPLEPHFEAVGLLGEPSLLATTDTIVGVGGTSGVQLFATTGATMRALGRRGTGVRGIDALGLVPGGAVAVGAPSGLYLYPAGTGPGELLREGATSAATATTARIYFAAGTRIEVAPVTADTTRDWPGIDIGAPVRTLATSDGGGILWAATDSALIALRPDGDSLVRVGMVAEDAPIRRISASGHLLAAALGEKGVRLYDVTQPASPRELARWTGARFVYDVSLVGNRLFAASGIEGVYVLSILGGNRLVVKGLARELGFAVALASRGGYTYILDRSTTSLRRIRSDFP